MKTFVGWVVSIISSLVHGLFPKLIERKSALKDQESSSGERPGFIDGEDIEIRGEKTAKRRKSETQTKIMIRGKGVRITQSIGKLLK